MIWDAISLPAFCMADASPSQLVSLAALIGTSLGAFIGALSGYYGGHVDNSLMRFTDIAYSIPTLPLLIVLSSFSNAAVPIIVLIIGFLSWMPTARVVRGSALSVKEKGICGIGAHDRGS